MASLSQGEVLDPRFVEMLKPIKDLTQNWEVPLAEILSGYMDELENLTITFDGGHTSVNFAQAALMLQGTAAIYSKKVEFLWQMVMKTLEMLSNKKVLEEDGGDDGVNVDVGQKGRKKQQVDMTREFVLLVADLGKNIDIKNDSESLEERKKALNFIYVTPRQLIDKEGSEQRAVKVNLYTGVAQAKWDLLGGKEDFRTNSQYVSITGMLGDDLKADNQYVDLRKDDSIPFNSAALDSPGDPSSCDIEDAHPSPNTSDQDDFNVSEGQSAQNMSSAAGGDCLASSASAPDIPSPGSPLNTTLEPEFDPWAPLDPFEQVGTPKPIKIGKTFRLPPSLCNTKRKTTKPLAPVSEYLMKEMSNRLYNPAMIPDVAPAFFDLAAQETVRRREMEKELRLERVTNRNAVRRDVFGDDGQDIFEQDDDDVPDDLADDNPDQFFDFDFPDPHVGGDIGPIIVEDLHISENIAGDPDSYEELVTRRVAQFVSQSQEYLKSSELTKRVAKWHEMIGPKLEIVERRQAFDIHAYGSKVLASVSNKKAIPFIRVVKGCKGEEVARFFLSTLMLANTENVEISTASGSDPQMGMDDVMLTLLTNTRHHHQLAEFQLGRQSLEFLDSGIGSTSGSSEAEDTPTSVLSGRQGNSKRPIKEHPSDKDKSSEDQFRVPEPPKSKGPGR